MSERRVYTGSEPTVFMTGNVGSVVPGQEFDVADEDLAAFDARRDISVPAPKRGVKKSSGDGDPVPPTSGDGV
jgi:hypothetical protein